MSKQVILDTSALIRFFTKDDENKAKKVKALLDSDKELVLIEGVLLELIFTLLKSYKVSKPDLIIILNFLLSHPNMIFEAYFQQAVALFEQENLSFVDCLVIVRSSGNYIASFDAKLLKTAAARSFFESATSKNRAGMQQSSGDE